MMYNELLRPARLYSRDHVLSRPSPVPALAGVYSWWFSAVPPKVPIADCLRHEAHVMLYVGISPKAPPKNNKPPSKQTLRSRIRYHFRGNAEGSTLRLTLGCLLSDQLGIELRQVGSGKRRTFTIFGEPILSRWMTDHAFVCWMPHDKPWEAEDELLRSVSLPLNLQGNMSHSFAETLRGIRKAARERATMLPVAV